MSTMYISKANSNDIPALVQLMNSAFRGEFSKNGWTSESDYWKGDQHTDIATLIELLRNPCAVVLKHTISEATIGGCVYLEKQGTNLYLGKLSVWPLLQTAGIGKTLLLAAEQYARELECRRIFMNVISLRKELVSWYERHGYTDTGERKRVPVDPKFGIPTQPLEFLIMEKVVD